MGIGVSCRNYCRTSNQRTANDRIPGKSPAAEAALRVASSLLMPTAPLVREDSVLLQESAGGRAFLS
jgi:hypothetical protein